MISSALKGATWAIARWFLASAALVTFGLAVFLGSGCAEAARSAALILFIFALLSFLWVVAAADSWPGRRPRPPTKRERRNQADSRLTPDLVHLDLRPRRDVAGRVSQRGALLGIAVGAPGPDLRDPLAQLV